ncbi:MAG: WYL domain-containing protein [Candidatus Sumerlaeia bacterium]|nr:WYL domain-containing protein [Candidatus Sumerlaeia bacterium]
MSVAPQSRQAGKPGPKAFMGEKGWRMIRTWQTVLIITEAEKALTAKEINDRLGVVPELLEYVGKVSTTRDDLWTLIRCGFPIRMLNEKGEEVDLDRYLDEERGSRRGLLKNMRWTLKESHDIGRITAPRHKVPTATDLRTLALLRALLQDNVPDGFPLYGQVVGLLGELHQWLGSRVHGLSHGDMIARFKLSGRRYVQSGPAVAILDRVTEALQRRVAIEGPYCTVHERETLVQALPLSAWFANNGRGHLLAARLADGALRVYRLDRFDSMTLLPDSPLPEVDLDEVDRLLAGSFGGFVAEPEEVHLIFDAEVAYLFEEFRFHPSQETTRRKGGDVEVLMTCALSYAYEEWLLGFGEHVEVKAPAHLRERIAERHRKAAERNG